MPTNKKTARRKSGFLDSIHADKPRMAPLYVRVKKENADFVRKAAAKAGMKRTAFVDAMIDKIRAQAR